MVFLLVFLITFSWIWIIPPSFGISVSSSLLGANINPTMTKIILWVGIAGGENLPVIFMEKGTLVHPRLRGTNLLTIFGFTEWSFVITNKAAYMDDDTWVNVGKVRAPGIKKIRWGMLLVFCLFYFLYI